MTNAQYGHPRLVALYDDLNPAGPDTAFWRCLAGVAPLRILDLGCGTGLLATLLAADGHAVTGLDPSPAMLDIARTRPDGEKVRWCQGDARHLSLDETFDLVLMTGHVFQVFLADGEVQSVLAGVKHHLAADGRLAFDSRNPHARAWEDWTPTASRRAFGGGACSHEVMAVDGEVVTFDTQYRFDDGMRLSTRSRLRFMSQAVLARQLALAGFGTVDWQGDWCGAPFGAAQAEIIAVCSR